MTTWFARLFITSCLFLVAYGCSIVPGTWEEFSFERRLSEYDIVVVGRDIRHINSINSSFHEDSQDSEFKVSCVLKGDEKPISENILIVGVYPVTSCQEALIYPGGDFIIGLTRDQTGQYVRHEVNILQEHAFHNTTANLNRVFQVCGFQSPMPPTGHVGAPLPFCQAKNITICISGVGKEAGSVAVLFVTFLGTFWLKMI